MMHRRLLVFLMLLALGCSRSQHETGAEPSSMDDSDSMAVADLYSLHCAGCHGADLEGGSATALFKDNWTYGRTRGLMIRNVKFGINQTDMAAFADLLSDEKIDALVDYIWDRQGEPVDRKVEIPEVLETEDYQIRLEQQASMGLEVPWAIEFTDHNRALISERKGQLRWLINGELDPVPIAGTPIPHTGTSTGGYMDIAADPNYQQNGWVYLAYSHSNGDFDKRSAPATTKIIRGRIKDHKWVEEQTLFLAPDSLWVSQGNRWGCRLLFDSNEHLYFSIGDMARAMDSQDPGKATGKIYRINANGSIPKDNPFNTAPGALKAVFSLGNRNAQGFSIHPETGEIWFSEHGPMGGDEINILKAGANYGWPLITYGKDYSGEVVSTKTHQEGMEQPIQQWTPSIGICPVMFVESARFPAWRHHLLVGALGFEQLQRLVIEDNKVVHSEMLLKGLGRVRDIKLAPDGSIYVVLNNPDLLLRVTVDGK